jgi:hypothetical protein
MTNSREYCHILFTTVCRRQESDRRGHEDVFTGSSTVVPGSRNAVMNKGYLPKMIPSTSLSKTLPVANITPLSET